MKRPLPTTEEAAHILATKRTRPQRRAPPAAGRKLGKFIAALDQRFDTGAGVLITRWKEIVGETLAKRTEPVKVSKPRGGGPGSLEIRVDGPAATLIQHQAGEIIARVNMFMGEGAVGKLRIVQGPVRKAEPPAGAARRRKPPLDAAAEASLEAGLAQAPDGPLKSALRTLGREVLRRER
jgi:hypothetical protein